MKACWSRFSLLSLMSALFAVLMWASVAAAQSSDEVARAMAANAAIARTIRLIVLPFVAAGYIYLSLALQTIANKTGTINGWLAWIPIANIFLLLNIAKKSLWWFVLCLIPLVNIVIAIMIWMGVAEARHKPNWWGILMIVPLINLFVPGYLAWSD